ncbi:MAG: thioredoxin [Bacteroidia bacterium]|nr:thioredoxin [Bacteroidia bacterium]
MNSFSESRLESGLVFVDFYTDWCEPCKLLEPILDDVQKKVGDALTIQKINVDEHRELAEQYDIRSVPTLMLFRNGELLWRMAGFDTADELVKIISSFN